ncbi:hypothetical protein PFISCL1PPCAC_4338, partial [Pristionchus fissidentatus]
DFPNMKSVMFCSTHPDSSDAFTSIVYQYILHKVLYSADVRADVEKLMSVIHVRELRLRSKDEKSLKSMLELIKPIPPRHLTLRGEMDHEL